MTYAPPLEPYLPIVFADDQMLIIDKPSGLLSVPGKGEDKADCVASRAVSLYHDALIVHRLDMATSGLMVLGRGASAQAKLSEQFAMRKTAKTYVAQVWGEMASDEGEVDLPLITDWPNRPKQMVCFERGKPALTRYRVLAREGGNSLVELNPVTGRSHQLRVHMLALGHPILGDTLYAHEAALQAADRLQLHAQDLSLFHPHTLARLHFHSDCPF